MSANIRWRPTDKKPKSLNVGAPSSFQEAMRRAGMQLPCTVGKENVECLNGMSATWTGDHNPYDQILELIEQFDSIELWAEY